MDDMTWYNLMGIPIPRSFFILYFEIIFDDAILAGIYVMFFLGKMGFFEKIGHGKFF